MGTRKAIIASSPLKSLLDWPRMDLEDAGKQLDVELEISQEMVNAKKAKISKSHSSHQSSKKRSNIPKRASKHHKKNNKRLQKRAKIRRVEIETGYKHPREFTSIGTTGADTSSIDGFDGLSKVPDFDGVNQVNDVQNLLETPKSSKKLDYYVEHFSKDPYLAYSEQQEWMNDNEGHMKNYRRRLGKPHKLKRSRTANRHTRDIAQPLSHKSTSKKVVIENGYQNEYSDPKELPVANFIPDADLPGLKANEMEDIRKLPYFGGVNNEKTILKDNDGKKLDIVVEHFSKDPFLAESEREEWMKGQIHFKP